MFGRIDILKRLGPKKSANEVALLGRSKPSLDAYARRISDSAEPLHDLFLKKTENRKHFLVLGNCQARAMAECLAALNVSISAKGVEFPTTTLAELLRRQDRGLLAALNQYDYIVAQPPIAASLVSAYPELEVKTSRFPLLGFSAFHPDLVYLTDKSTNKPMHGPLGHYNSAIAFWGFARGLSVDETAGFFNELVYGQLGYFDFWHPSQESLLHQGVLSDLPLAELFKSWVRFGCFMHSVNHPKLFVVADIAATLLSRLGYPSISRAVNYVHDESADGPVWPVYPEIAKRLGVEGDYFFKIEKGRCPTDLPVLMLDLREFLEGSFSAFSKIGVDRIHCERLESGRFDGVDRLLLGKALAPDGNGSTDTPRPTTVGAESSSPYRDLPRYQFWKNGITQVPPADVDPVVVAPFRISRNMKVATAGSCFAQHISEALTRAGFNHFVVEGAGDLPVQEARERNFGTFSARFGNLYTARQLLQLFERSYGLLTPLDVAWLRRDGKWVDPFRLAVEPRGYASVEEVVSTRETHFSCVREMFEKLDVFVFTLGLTEAWRAREDGAVFPLAPGVSAGHADPGKYEFVNFTVDETIKDLERFLSLLKSVNAKARVILTVSPVPLIATYESRHVLVSNTYSKSVLRTAAGDICKRHMDCAYFPSFEVITGNYSRGMYYEADLRGITSAGVTHVMRLFFRHFCLATEGTDAATELLDEFRRVNSIVCDEEAIINTVA